MKLLFSTSDLEQLMSLTEKELYMLNRDLFQYVSELKGNPLFSSELLCDVVRLAETAAKEISCRKRWSPRPANGEYSCGGISYDTDEYRDWLLANRNITENGYSILERFSFCDELMELINPM